MCVQRISFGEQHTKLSLLSSSDVCLLEGWDVMVRGDEPLFIEFNINNGFYVADHTVRPP